MPSKGNQYFVEAASRVLKAVPDVRFYIVGEGELQPELEAQAARLGLGNRLVFTGFQSDVAVPLAAFDLIVFPSLWEGTPLTSFEALAMGKPIVSTDADGLRDILVDDRDAVIVPRADAGALADAIVGLVGDPARGASGWAKRPSARVPGTTFKHSCARWNGSTSCSTRILARPVGRASCKPTYRFWMTTRVTDSNQMAGATACGRPGSAGRGRRRVAAPRILALGRLSARRVRVPERRVDVL